MVGQNNRHVYQVETERPLTKETAEDLKEVLDEAAFEFLQGRIRSWYGESKLQVNQEVD